MGRQCSSVSLNQCHAPTTGREVVTVSLLSTAARLDGVAVSLTITGIATPTVASFGDMNACRPLVSLTVKLVADCDRAPPAAAAATTLYRAPN